MNSKKCTVPIYTYKMFILTHTQVTTPTSTVYTTLDYECTHEKKGIGLILVPRKCEVYELDQKSYSTDLH